MGELVFDVDPVIGFGFKIGIWTHCLLVMLA